MSKAEKCRLTKAARSIDDAYCDLWQCMLHLIDANQKLADCHAGTAVIQTRLTDMRLELSQMREDLNNYSGIIMDIVAPK
jgi:hypothetical protein